MPFSTESCDRKFSNKLVSLCDEGRMNLRNVFVNLVCNYLSEDAVKDFCETEYEDWFNDTEY